MTFLTTELGSAYRLSPCPGLRRGHRRRRDRAPASGVASRRGPSLGGGGLRRARCGRIGGLRRVRASSRSSVDALVFLTTQQFHARQVTSRPIRPENGRVGMPIDQPYCCSDEWVGTPPRPTLRLLIAPDSFGDTLTAVEAAAAIAAGWNRVRPGDHITVAPQSDGGPGIRRRAGQPVGGAAAAAGARPAERGRARRVGAGCGVATAYLECAQACGLALLGGPPTPQTALAAQSRGVGQLIAAALDAGAIRIVVGLGGTASTDGGRGLIEELGGLHAARRRLAGVELIAACDVEYPLVGPWGAARVFGPQKGADPDTVAALEERLAQWAGELDAAAGRPVSAESGAGAAGGIGAALLSAGRPMRVGSVDRRRAHRLGRRPCRRRSGDHRGGKVRRPVAARQGGRRAGRGGAIGAGAGGGAGRTGRLWTSRHSSPRAFWRPASVSDYAGSVRLALADAANQLIGLAAAGRGTTRE